MGAPLLGDAKQPRSFQRAASLLGVAVGLVLLGSLAWPSPPTPPPSEAMAALGTPLAALGSRFRTAGVLGRTMQGRTVQDTAYGLAPGPLDQIRRLAVTAIEANSHACQARDISMKAEAKADEKVAAAASNLDSETKEKVEKVAKSVALKAEEMVGVTGPMGFFDPLGFSTNTPAGKLLFYREAELKHGRLCMLASLGFLVGERFHPLFGGNIDVPSVVAFQETPLQNFWPAVLAAIGLLEAPTIGAFYAPDGGKDKNAKYWMMKEDHVPGMLAGALSGDPFNNLEKMKTEKFKNWQNRELNNGRLAMFAAAGMIAQELATGQKLF